MISKRLKIDPDQDPAYWYAYMLTRKFKDEGPHSKNRFSVEPGRVYDRIIQEDADSTAGSVHCFVRKSDGAVLKAAGYKKPALHARYISVQAALPEADLYGGYLYLR